MVSKWLLYLESFIYWNKYISLLTDFSKYLNSLKISYLKRKKCQIFEKVFHYNCAFLGDSIVRKRNVLTIIKSSVLIVHENKVSEFVKFSRSLWNVLVKMHAGGVPGGGGGGGTDLMQVNKSFYEQPVFYQPWWCTVLPRLVRRRTIKLMSFLIKKNPLILSNFLRFLSFFSRETLIWNSYDTDKLYLPTQRHSKS